MTTAERDRLVRRFTAKTVVDADGCHMWTAANNGRYATFSLKGRTAFGHQLAWILVHGRALRPGYVVDHLCRNTLCVNADHLEEVTIQVNILRGTSPAALNALKFECSRGHLLAGDNLYVMANGWRQCRLCQAFRLRRSAAMKKLKALEVTYYEEHGEATA
ncbi:hypothetical protein B2J88_32170 [Rhodococcus sp. SRB_17]|nr:hypothetical protein [Rhodococcus sp. SRB_17]